MNSSDPSGMKVDELPPGMEGSLYEFLNNNGGGATWTPDGTWTAVNGQQTMGAPSSDAARASALYDVAVEFGMAVGDAKQMAFNAYTGVGSWPASGASYRGQIDGRTVIGYPSQEQAAASFGFLYGAVTRTDRVENAYKGRKGQEYGAVIAEWNTPTGNLYTIENIVYSSMPGREYRVDKNGKQVATGGQIDPWGTPFESSDFFIDGATVVATIHTHPSNEEVFSRTTNVNIPKDDQVFPNISGINSDIKTAYLVSTGKNEAGVRKASVSSEKLGDLGDNWLYGPTKTW